MQRTTRTLSIAFLIMMVGLAFSQDNRFPLEIIDMPIGKGSKELISQVKTEITKSQLFRLTDKNEVRLQMRFQANDVTQSDASDMNIYSIVFTLATTKQTGDRSTFLSQTVGHCRSDELDKCAKRVLKQAIEARANIQEMIVAILDGRIDTIIQSYSAN